MTTVFFGNTTEQKFTTFLHEIEIAGEFVADDIKRRVRYLN
jgi:hypothetical protein